MLFKIKSSRWPKIRFCSLQWSCSMFIASQKKEPFQQRFTNLTTGPMLVKRPWCYFSLLFGFPDWPSSEQLSHKVASVQLWKGSEHALQALPRETWGTQRVFTDWKFCQMRSWGFNCKDSITLFFSLAISKFLGLEQSKGPKDFSACGKNSVQCSLCCSSPAVLNK